MSSEGWRPFCLGPNVFLKELKYTVAYYSVHVYGPLWFHFDDTEANRAKQAWEKLKACTLMAYLVASCTSGTKPF